jgi:hypothetical protein
MAGSQTISGFLPSSGCSSRITHKTPSVKSAIAFAGVPAFAP